jgi:hypothetical protein
MSFAKILNPFFENFSDLIMILAEMKGGGENVRLHHIKEGLDQLNKPVIFSSALLKDWKVSIETFHKVMDETDVPYMTITLNQAGEEIKGVIVTRNQEQLDSILQQFEDDEDTAETQKTSPVKH